MSLSRFILLVAVVVLAGCVGAPVADDADTTSSPTSSATTQSPAYMDCNASLHVSPAEQAPDDATVVAFEDLPADRQSEFEQAREGYAMLPGESDAANFWFETRYVSMDGGTFSTTLTTC
ncbi:hypothetical protein ACH9L7_14465 [Haloferax sp. S1W]|uniref:hypothetical protein n=1 Tax=Haloferax sp. S1W TaxID=3377110 RepID=UPI0037CB2877